MDDIRSYRDLRVWQAAMDLAEAAYRATGDFPKAEMYGLVTQIRRSTVSVPSNIAEGYGREVTGSYLQHLRIAQGSLKEAETQLLLSQRLGFLSAAQGADLLTRCESTGKMLRALIRSVSRSL